jgi:mRNA interferase RelE/StbE
MLELAADPYPSGTQKLRGYENSYRLRVGHYRILYEISGQDVTVVAVKHRREVYRDMD